MNLKILLFLIFLLSPILILASEKIDINTASLEELEKLTGVGPVIAQRIIDDRPFSSVDDLIKVKGIGPKKLANIKKQGLAWVNNVTSEPPSQQQQTDRELIVPIKENSSPKITKIDINSAPLEDLVKIIHIGEVRAQQLISLRPFYSLDDLTRIRGIGEKSLEDIKKQSLAWVDPNLKPPTKEESNLPEKGTASAADTFQKTNQSSKPLTTFLIALILAIFSGIIILVIKLRLKENTQGKLRV